MNKIILKNTTLKEFVDFAFSLTEMEEVKEKGFPIPKAMTFSLDKKNHEALQKEVLREKNMPMNDIVNEFDIELYGIKFKFLIK